MRKLRVILALLGVMILCTACGKKEVKLADYIKVEYEGYSGFATAIISIDKEGISKALVDSKNMKSDEAKTFAETIKVEERRELISNGDRLVIGIECDESLLEDKKVSMAAAEFTASGIEEPQVLDVFAELEVKINGVSPKAWVSVNNTSDNEYISKLQIKVVPEGFVKVGDTVSVCLVVDEIEAAKAGYAFKQVSQEYVIGEIGQYPQTADELDRSVLTQIDNNNKEAIKNEAADTTKHMMWRLSGNVQYLTGSSAERVEICELTEVYYLKEKTLTADRENNYMYFVYEAVITDGTDSETGYFIFEYKNAVMSNGEFIIGMSKPEERYTCNADKEVLYKENVEVKLEEYDEIVVDVEKNN